MESEDDTDIDRQRRLATMIFGWALVAFGLVWCVAAWSLPPKRLFEPIPIGMLPMFGGLLLAVAGANIVWTYYRIVPTAKADGEPLFDWQGQARVLAVVAIVIAYTLVLERVHYMITTFIAAAGVLYVAGEPLGWRLPLKALAMSAILFVVFIRWFDILLPGGRLY